MLQLSKLDFDLYCFCVSKKYVPCAYDCACPRFPLFLTIPSVAIPGLERRVSGPSDLPGGTCCPERCFRDDPEGNSRADAAVFCRYSNDRCRSFMETQPANIPSWISYFDGFWEICGVSIQKQLFCSRLRPIPALCCTQKCFHTFDSRSVVGN